MKLKHLLFKVLELYDKALNVGDFFGQKGALVLNLFIYKTLMSLC